MKLSILIKFSVSLSVCLSVCLPQTQPHHFVIYFLCLLSSHQFPAFEPFYQTKEREKKNLCIITLGGKKIRKAKSFIFFQKVLLFVESVHLEQKKGRIKKFGSYLGHFFAPSPPSRVKVVSALISKTNRFSLIFKPFFSLFSYIFH